MQRTILIIIFVAVAASLAFFVFSSFSGLNKNSAGTLEQAEANIIVTSPQPNDTVYAGSLSVRGRARVFENQFNIRLKSGSTIIYEGAITSNAQDAGQYGDFDVSIPISPRNVSLGTAVLEVFDYSPKDGSEIDKASIPLSLSL